MALVMVGTTLASAGCAVDRSSTPATPLISGARTLVCQASTRPSVSVKPEPLGEIRMSEPGDRSLTSKAFRFRVLYSDDRYDGRTVVAYVYSASTGKLIAETLFQFDRQQAVANQFRGGHGFTGLHYVYAPDSDSELQYICSFD